MSWAYFIMRKDNMDNYESFKKQVLAMSSIDLNAYKEKQMKRRIDSLISKNGFKSYDEYVKGLKNDKDLYEAFINYLTINVSEFWRNPEQWTKLEKEIIPYLIEKHGRNMKIWSAACSTGDEPYSLVMLLAKFMPLSQIKIIATDIDKQVLETAQIGVYTYKSVKGLPKDLLEKYFTKLSSNSYKISDEVKKRVEFKRHNLLKDPYPTGCSMIVCRNVVIYFTDEAKDEIFKKFNASLRQNGVLFVGSTEQIIQATQIGFESKFSFFYIKG